MKYMGSHYRRKSFQILIIKTIRVALARAGTRPLFIENSSTVRVQAVSYHYQMDGYTVSPPESFRTDLYGIDEVDGGFPRDGLRTCAQKSNNGKNVSIWILDTGCEPSPGGLCADFTGEQVGTCTDNDGHGTAMGQIASDAEFGVAPAATRHCLRVLVDTANGDWTNVLRGLAFVGAQNLKSKGKVINLSLSGPVASNTRSVPVILRELGRMGFFTVGAAGNDRSNACDQIPASFRGDRFFSVQAHDESGNPFSNNNFATSGSDCIDLSAPGVNIRTTPVAIAQDLGENGTSQAAAHVSGAIAVLLSDNREVNMLSLTQNGRLIDNGMERGMSLVDKESLGLSCPQRRKTRKFSSSNRKGHRGY
ncbi:Proprotein convertase subtilisin/kexin type 9 [Gracilariopsis chorda]|uniref:Proprotein convertase subtilisin/kexin type 9 n=1 Tax=Gracilariopsis chorda TaxID=448386 RepID=A0A2V3ISN3_9FLOR|nr:Proprotein convertase subtilisin/kexin type 9 [Gracilariopsis chorda]|eukprot:PXF44757.1 Proprotein convertase subtilisin/kexin type 9 [Gracilariopsis chorda]